MSSKKRKCTFNADLEKEFPRIIKRAHKGDNEGGVCCKICEKTFSIACMGRAAIVQHNSYQEHKEKEKRRAISKPMTDFFRAEKASSEDLTLAAKEATIAYHTVNHDQSFQSVDCTSKLLANLFEKKFSCGRTKCTAIVTNSLYPHEVDKLKKEMETVQFVNVAVDCSNHKAIKLMPVAVRFFSRQTGVCVRVLEVHSLEGETSQIMVNRIMQSLDKFSLRSKVIGFCGDNANVNFGGLNRNGRNNVFHHLKSGLENDNLVGIGCEAHIVHNGVSAAVDVIPFDVESILRKIYNHFSIYTLRNEKLKEYCAFVEVDFKTILSSCKTRWLSLVPALTRTLEMFEALKSYFLSEDNTAVLKAFFENPVSELYMIFLEAQLQIFNDTIQIIERDKISAVEVQAAIQRLLDSLRKRFEETFVGLKAKLSLEALIATGQVNELEFMKTVRKFYEIAISYIEKWQVPIEEICLISWTTLSRQLEWDQVEKSVAFFNKRGIQIDDNRLFDEFSCVKKFADIPKQLEWKEKKTAVDSRWMELFKHFETQDVQLKNISTMVSFALTLPGSNAYVERVFSLINNYWTDKKGKLSMPTLEAAVWMKVNVTKSCQEYFEYLKTQPKLLQHVHSTEKYCR